MIVVGRFLSGFSFASGSCRHLSRLLCSWRGQEVFRSISRPGSLSPEIGQAPRASRLVCLQGSFQSSVYLNRWFNRNAVLQGTTVRPQRRGQNCPLRLSSGLNTKNRMLSSLKTGENVRDVPPLSRIGQPVCGCCLSCDNCVFFLCDVAPLPNKRLQLPGLMQEPQREGVFGYQSETVLRRDRRPGQEGENSPFLSFDQKMKSRLQCHCAWTCLSAFRFAGDRLVQSCSIQTPPFRTSLY